MKAMLLVLAAAIAASSHAASGNGDPRNVAAVSVVLHMTNSEYLIGERIRGEVEIKNGSATPIVVGAKDSTDFVFLELFKNDAKHSLDRYSDRKVTNPFVLKSGEAQKFEVFFDRNYLLDKEGRYLGRAVVVHDGMRYEGSFRAFSLVPGIRISGALQMFSNRPELRREFELLYWNRRRHEHLFLRATDRSDKGDRAWVTSDLGTLIRVTPPKISIRDGGEVTVLHRATQDEFIRSDFWSLPDAFEFQEHARMVDPDVAGSERVKSLYEEASGVEPVKKAWWKFW